MVLQLIRLESAKTFGSSALGRRKTKKGRMNIGVLVCMYDTAGVRDCTVDILRGADIYGVIWRVGVMGRERKGMTPLHIFDLLHFSELWIETVVFLASIYQKRLSIEMTINPHFMLYQRAACSYEVAHSCLLIDTKSVQCE